MNGSIQRLDQDTTQTNQCVGRGVWEKQCRGSKQIRTELKPFFSLFLRMQKHIFLHIPHTHYLSVALTSIFLCALKWLQGWKNHVIPHCLNHKYMLCIGWFRAFRWTTWRENVDSINNDVQTKDSTTLWLNHYSKQKQSGSLVYYFIHISPKFNLMHYLREALGLC